MLRTSSRHSPRQAGTRGALYLWPDSFLYIGEDVAPDLHRHNAVECAVALDGPLRIKTESGSTVEVDEAVLVDANVRHSISGPCGEVAFLYLEKAFFSSPSPCERMTGRVAPGISTPGPTVSAALREKLCKLSPDTTSDAEAYAAKMAILSLLAPFGPAQAPLDPRIRLALAHIAAHADTPPGGGELAALVGLSPDRFQHLFKQNIGMPVRRYLLWFRIRRVLKAVSEGANLTRAAHEAGFSDSAHFSRTFRAMVGNAPSEIFNRTPHIAITICQTPE
jgi:AraC-like DNA-binding protein